MKSEKRKTTEVLPNHESVRTPREKENYKYLGILEADTIKWEEMKEKITREYFRRTRKLLESKLCGRYLIKVLNTWAVPLCKILWTILKMDTGRTNGPKYKKVDDGVKASHLRDDIDCMSREKKEEEDLPTMRIASIH